MISNKQKVQYKQKLSSQRIECLGVVVPISFPILCNGFESSVRPRCSFPFFLIFIYFFHLFIFYFRFYYFFYFSINHTASFVRFFVADKTFSVHPYKAPARSRRQYQRDSKRTNKVLPAGEAIYYVLDCSSLQMMMTSRIAKKLKTRLCGLSMLSPQPRLQFFRA